jgi:hypothetical protein
VRIFYGRIEYSIEDVAPLLAYPRAYPEEIDQYQRVTLDNIKELMFWGIITTPNGCLTTFARYWWRIAGQQARTRESEAQKYGESTAKVG